MSGTFLMTLSIKHVNVIIACAERILELGNRWYKPSPEWKQFLLNVHRLRARLDFLKRRLSNFTLPWSDSDLVGTPVLDQLRKAKVYLQRQQHELENIYATSGSTCDHHLAILFQAEVGLLVEGALEFLDGYRYVPLEESEDKIYAALDSPNGPQVVLFHGGAGKGKSTVARNIVLHYSESKTQFPAQFDHVILLNCGYQVRIEETQFELVQRLGFRPCPMVQRVERWQANFAIQKQIKSLLALGLQPYADIQDGENGQSALIRKELKGLLLERKVLLILDDVRDGEFVRRIMQLCGPGVKCFITSEQASVCRSLDHYKCISIEIQDIDLDDARKILACYLRLPNNLIPPDLKSTADIMIAETDLNPLALANLASVIDPNRSRELRVWEAASKRFFRALKSKVPPGALNGNYPRSLWATMGLTISTLNEDARNLLVLIHACEGPSVPDEVVQMLYTGMKLHGESTTFSNVRRQLERRQLISLCSLPSVSLGEQTTWEVHSLHKRYIEVEMRDARDSIFASLALVGSTPFPNLDSNPDQMCDSSEGSKYLSTAVGLGSLGNVQSLPELEPEDSVTTALCALYLEKHLAEKASAKLGFPLEVFNTLKRKAIEPVTRLLALAVSDSWTQSARDCATKVFLLYACSGLWEAISVSQLLTNSTGAMAMSRALVQMAIIEEKTFRWGKSCPEILMGALVDNLDLTRENQIQGAARLALEVTARLNADNGLNDSLLVSFQGALHTAVLSISKFQHREGWSEPCQYRGITLDRRFDRENPKRTPLEMPNDEDYAAYILNKLAFGVDEIKIKIASQPGALQGLACLLQKQERASGIAARTLTTLALADIDIIKEYVKATAAKTNESVTDGLVSLVKGAQWSLIRPDTSILGFYYREREYFAMVALTVFDPIRGNQLRLRSGLAYGGRGYANFFMGVFERALEDLTKAHEMEPEDSSFLRHLRTLRAKMGDLQGALALADKAVNVKEIEELGFDLQERGVLKIMMLDFHGALEDLNKGLELTNDDYEMLKHRGHVRFLLGDAIGAREDGDRAIKIQPPSVNHRLYGNVSACLGATSVEYLGLKLT